MKKLVQIEETGITGIVYETGSFSDKKWKDAQPLPNVINVMMSAIEAFGEVK